MKSIIRYLALHEAGLHNGSFFRIIERVTEHEETKRIAQYINGDFMCLLDKEPTEYCAQSLNRFDQKTAEKLIPKVCGGKR